MKENKNGFKQQILKRRIKKKIGCKGGHDIPAA